MQRLRTVTSFDVSAVAGHHAMPAALLLYVICKGLSVELSCMLTGHCIFYYNTYLTLERKICFYGSNFFSSIIDLSLERFKEP